MVKIFKATSKSTQLGQECTVTISRLDINGCGVASYNKKSLFIDGALPHEKVTAKIIEQKGKYFRGKLLNIVTRSDKRTDVPCQHFAQCGGCDLQHLTLEEQLNFKQNKVAELFARNKVSLDSVKKHPKNSLPWQETLQSHPWHYRRKARIGVQYDKTGQVTVGFRYRGSNRLVPIKKCLVLNEPLAELFIPLRSTITQLSGKNAVGHIEVINTDVMTLIVRQLVKLTAQDKALWSAFSQRFQCQVIFDCGDKLISLNPNDSLNYSLKLADNQPIKLFFSADDFIQVNHHVNIQMVSQAVDWLSLERDDKVLDLFCGLGNFSLPIAKLVNHVVGIEGVDKMVEQAKSNALENNIHNCDFYQADLNSDWKKEAWAKESYDKVLLDPARAGAYQAIEQLVYFNVSTILYVSCDPATLAKDSALLFSHGYTIEKICLIDMFCQTKHIETMVLFSLQDK